MAARPNTGKLYPLFTLAGRSCVTGKGEFGMVSGIAIAMFVALVGWGSQYFGWSDPDGKVQLALAACYILGAISAYRARG
jgi:hypothetical protein